MAIEHLHLDTPVPINPDDLPFLLTDQLLAEHGDQMEVLKPGKYDMTPENTGYPRGPLDYVVEVSRRGTAICGEDPRQDVIHQARGKLEQRAIHMPETATQLAIIDMRRLSVFGLRTGIPHIFDILRWKPDDDSLSYMPAVAIATSDPEAKRDLRPHLGSIQSPLIFLL